MGAWIVLWWWWWCCGCCYEGGNTGPIIYKELHVSPLRLLFLSRGSAALTFRDSFPPFFPYATTTARYGVVIQEACYTRGILGYTANTSFSFFPRFEKTIFSLSEIYDSKLTDLFRNFAALPPVVPCVAGPWLPFP